MPIHQIAKALDINPSLLAFKPRQVVLLSNPQIMKLDDANDKILNAEQQTLLFHSVAQFLQRRGFSKTLKKFLSEAKIQKDDLGDSSIHLEEMFCRFLDISSHGNKKSKNATEVITNDAVDSVPKSKEKKRNKNDSYSLDQEEQVTTKILEEPDHGRSNKSKDKRRKKNKQSSDPVIHEQEPNKGGSKKDDFHSLTDDVTEKENKSSKKRKRAVPEEDSVQPASEKLVESKNEKKEKSKRRKTQGSAEPRIAEESRELNSPIRTEEKVQKEGSSQVVFTESQQISVKQVNGLSNGNLEENGDKSASRKNMKKEQNGSAEPKTVKKHFQRINVDEVVFSDERLKDNSYWAKDGAEIGFGAKAQEVLGQVRGRGFRHEKTKKKRGSYRGGQIDLQSHSVKFNYSDED